jgi:hypothetical protein
MSEPDGLSKTLDIRCDICQLTVHYWLCIHLISELGFVET